MVVTSGKDDALYKLNCARGEAVGSAKLTEKQVQKMRRDHRRFNALVEKYKGHNMAKRHGISRATYERVIYYDSWTHVEDT